MERNYFSEFFNFITKIIQVIIGIFVGLVVAVIDLGCSVIYYLALIWFLIWLYHLVF